jgi:hypothetical protein
MRKTTWIIVLVLAACGDSSEGEETTGGETTGGETTGGETQAATQNWADMDQEARGRYMATVVMPEMQTMFQEFNAEEYGDFGCETCHGANAREVNFSMPNGLAPLDPASIPAMFQSTQPMAQFMTQRVWPRMTELLQMQPYDPETHQGFSCLNCHATSEAPAK